MLLTIALYQYFYIQFNSTLGFFSVSWVWTLNIPTSPQESFTDLMNLLLTNRVYFFFLGKQAFVLVAAKELRKPWTVIINPLYMSFFEEQSSPGNGRILCCSESDFCDIFTIPLCVLNDFCILVRFRKYNTTNPERCQGAWKMKSSWCVYKQSSGSSAVGLFWISRLLLDQFYRVDLGCFVHLSN